MRFKLQVNGAPRDVEADPDTPLLWVLRDELRLTGTKFGCGVAQCGACTVHVAGKPARSCALPVAAVGERPVVTIEGVAGPVAEAVQAAWTEMQVPQCGYCQSGQIMTAVNLVTEVPAPTDADIDGAFAGNICRCATYLRIRQAVRRAAQTQSG
ncbi:MAG TPA: (2Fe-2S)-binding protein [Polyangiaceae bacterium]|nr:(2Fe-2S)-binding protein [Polyangiaceae bacterium]